MLEKQRGRRKWFAWPQYLVEPQYIEGWDKYLVRGDHFTKSPAGLSPPGFLLRDVYP
jgi:hypothetical protein